MTTKHPLKNIYDQIGSTDLEYKTKNTHALEHATGIEFLTSKESLRIHGPDQAFELATFKDQRSLARYIGLDAKQMRNTIERLNLPQRSNNKSHVAMRVFGNHLHARQGAAVLSLRILPETEPHYRDLFARLEHIYNGNKINHEFYAARSKGT